jgi:hypothetical protein
MTGYTVRKWLRDAGLLDKARALKHRFSGKPQWYNFKGDPRTVISTLKCFAWLQERNLLEGTDYFEFGIFRGFNLWMIQAYANAMGVRDMRFAGFDSFMGLPEVTDIDKGGPFQAGDFSAYREEVETHFRRYGVDWEKTLLIEGYYDKSLNDETIRKHKLRQCSLCVVDCDLYASTVPVLAFVRPLLTDPGIIFFDDWEDYGDSPLKGEPKAFAEFMHTNEATLEAEPFVDLKVHSGKGKAFVIRRRKNATPRADR